MRPNETHLFPKHKYIYGDTFKLNGVLNIQGMPFLQLSCSTNGSVAHASAFQRALHRRNGSIWHWFWV